MTATEQIVDMPGSRSFFKVVFDSVVLSTVSTISPVRLARRFWKSVLRSVAVGNPSEDRMLQCTMELTSHVRVPLVLQTIVQLVGVIRFLFLFFKAEASGLW